MSKASYRRDTKVTVIEKNEARCAEFAESLPGATLLLSFAMLLGRLEVFPLLLGLNPLIWKKEKIIRR